MSRLNQSFNFGSNGDKVWKNGLYTLRFTAASFNQPIHAPLLAFQAWEKNVAWHVLAMFSHV
jgi:hypothetical protein